MPEPHYASTFRHCGQEKTDGNTNTVLPPSIDNALTDAELKVFERHLKICAECNDYIKHYKQTIKLAVRSMEVNIPAEIGNPPEDLINAILDARKQNP